MSELATKAVRVKNVKPPKTLNETKRRARAGWLFITPFIIGFALFFIQPMITSFIYSLYDVRIQNGINLLNAVNEFEAAVPTLGNYIRIFTSDPNFLPQLGTTTQTMLMQTLVITIFALFVAVVLNQKFKGRVLARSVFFLPVIITSGIIIAILKDDVLGNSMQGAASNQYVFQGSGLSDMLYSLNFMPPAFIDGFINTVSQIFDMIWKSGVQILLFLAALQSIGPQLYEAARVEGATGWESFWKITFPMISPIIMVNVFYTIIDSYTDYSDKLMKMIFDTAFAQQYGYSSAMAWVFFAVALLIIGVINFALSRMVFYQSE